MGRIFWCDHLQSWIADFRSMFNPFWSDPLWSDMILYKVLLLYSIVNRSGNSPILLSHLEYILHPSIASLYFTLSFLYSMFQLWSFILLKKKLWLRVRYESTVEIHSFCLFSIIIIWLVASRVHRKSNRFDLIFKI